MAGMKSFLQSMIHTDSIIPDDYSEKCHDSSSFHSSPATGLSEDKSQNNKEQALNKEHQQKNKLWNVDVEDSEPFILITRL